MARRWAKIAAGAAACLAVALLIAGALAFSWLRENQRGKQLMEAANAALLKNDYDGALRGYGAALRCRMSDRNLAMVYSSRSVVHLARREFDAAIGDLTAALEKVPNIAPLIAKRADVYRQKGDLDRALADYSKAIELAPNDFSALFNRAVIFLQRGEPDVRLRAVSGAGEVFFD